MKVKRLGILFYRFIMVMFSKTEKEIRKKKNRHEEILQVKLFLKILKTSYGSQRIDIQLSL